MDRLCLGHKAYDLMKRIYMTSRRLDNIRKDGVPPVVEALVLQALSRLWKKAADMNLTEDDLSSVSERIWIDASSDDVSFSYRDSCVEHLKHVQNVSEGEGNSLLACSHAGDRECSPFCGYYQEATPEQVERFESGMDLG